MASLEFKNVSKTFTMHLQGGTRLMVLEDVNFRVAPGECVVLTGPSGAGKSTVLKLAYGNYRTHTGSILVEHEGKIFDVAAGDPRTVLAARRQAIGYVSQFLSVIPRVSALDLVTDAARTAGRDAPEARAKILLDRLNLPERIWNLPPATFSGGEQQRVNIAMSFVGRHPILLLDEPTAALDAANRQVLVDLTREKIAEGVAILSIFHDEEVRTALATRRLDVSAFEPAAAA